MDRGAGMWVSAIWLIVGAKGCAPACFEGPVQRLACASAVMADAVTPLGAPVVGQRALSFPVSPEPPKADPTGHTSLVPTLLSTNLPPTACSRTV